MNMNGTLIPSTSTYAFADITKASNNSNLASKHDVSGALDTIDKRFAASVVVVKFGLGDGVVDVDSRDLEFTFTEGLVEVVDTGRGLLGETPDI
jgi:hypothetical protein